MAATLFASGGCMINRCCNSTLISAPTGGTLANLRCRKQKHFSKTYQYSSRRDLGTMEHKQYRKGIHKFYCKITNHSCIRNTRTGLENKMHPSAANRSYVFVSAVVADQGAQALSTSDTQSFDFWGVAFASLAAVGVSIGLMHYFPSEGQNLLRLEGCDGYVGNWFNIDSGGSNSSGDGDPGTFAAMAFASASPTQQEQRFYEHTMKSDVEMTLHQPPSIRGQEMAVNAVSAETRAIQLNEPVSSTKPYDISVRAVRGGRVTMEDEFFVADGGRFVAVFDGHGGGGVSQYLKNHLYDAVCNHVQIKHWEENDALLNPPSPTIRTEACDKANVRNSDSVFVGNPSVFSFAAALKSAFSEMEYNVLKNDTLQFQGSTAVAVLIHEKYDIRSNATSKGKHRTLLSANIGDSRAVLSRNGHAVELTRDHKPNDDQEKARILDMGETIQWDRVSKVHRVRNLSLSRAIGDKYAKPVVSGEVEINHYPIIDRNDEFILLASDGLWDVMTSEEAVAFVHEKIRKELSSINVAKGDFANFTVVLRRNMAKFVAREAIRRGSSDNVCVVMVWLDELG